LVGAGTYNSEIHAGVLNLLHRTTLAELITILRQATFVVSVDSGPMHLAAALGTPLLSVHTWSDPRRVGPYVESAWIWQGGQIRRQNLNLTPRPQKPFSPEDACETANFVALEILRLTQT
jgi:ADP-heptose:LPS heptosyltransferase